MTIPCKHCQAEFLFDEEDRQFIRRLDPSIEGNTFSLPAPTLCPACRLQRRASFRNDQHYYRGACLLCKKSLISIYSPDKAVPILCHDCYWSDRFDPLEYGCEYDFDRPFFEQFLALKTRVPRLAIFNTLSENSEYTVHSSRNRNCYLGSSLIDCEDIRYADLTHSSKDSQDLFSCLRLQQCYDCIYSIDCYACDALEYCEGLRDSSLCAYCRAGNNLLACVGIRQGSFMLLNQVLSKQDFEAARLRFKTDPQYRDQLLSAFAQLKKSAHTPASWNVSCENVLGDQLSFCRNVHQGFNLRDHEDARYFYESSFVRDCMDGLRVGRGELLYECTGIVELSLSAFCNLCYQGSNLLYCDNCQGRSQHCFGGMALKGQKYCILNKVYSPAEYAQLASKIIKQMQEQGAWGEFFPTQLSPFGYNESKAAELFPLAKVQVEQAHWRWSDYEPVPPTGKLVVRAAELPTKITEVPDDATQWAIQCEASGKLFRITAQELAFYRSQNIALPRRAPQQRHLDRIARRHPYQLSTRSCTGCGATIQSTVRAAVAEQVFCDECYLRSVYG
jgi:hypothetical protein